MLQWFVHFWWCLWCQVECTRRCMASVPTISLTGEVLALCQRTQSWLTRWRCSKVRTCVSRLSVCLSIISLVLEVTWKIVSSFLKLLYLFLNFNSFVEISPGVFIKDDASLSHHRSSISTNKFNFTVKSSLCSSHWFFIDFKVITNYKEFLICCRAKSFQKSLLYLKLSDIGVQLKGKKQETGTAGEIGTSLFVLHYLAAFTLF